VLGLLWYLQRRFSRSSTRRREAETITVLGRQGLGAKAQLVMVQTVDARYVLGVTEHGVSVIDRLSVSAATGADGADATRTASQHPIVDAASEPAASGVAVFDSILAAESSPEQTSSPSTARDPAVRLRVRHRSDPLRGSIISPATWRQTVEAIRRSR